MLVVVGALLVTVGALTIAWGVVEWRARDYEARIAIEDAFRTAHYRVLQGRIHVLCRFPGAKPVRRTRCQSGPSPAPSRP
jgi:hypothetical protein